MVRPALKVINALPKQSQQIEHMLGIVINAVIGCMECLRRLQLDHAGPIYHSLLETAKYQGSFYTSTPAAILLAELAMPQQWAAIDNDWSNGDRLRRLKICDPAEGTGTLVMAVAKVIGERFMQAGGSQEEWESLYRSLIEDVLYGLDINYHAIHLAASMLTIAAPRIDYDKMNLYTMQQGIDSSGKVRVGSLDLLVNEESFIPELAPETPQKRITRTGHKEDIPEIKGRCSLVIMNPPFTRIDIRNLNMSSSVRSKVQKREREIAKETADPAHREAIDLSTLFSYFPPIADLLLNEKGTVAIIQPFAACTGTAARGYRKLMTNPEKFQVEMVITSHDNNRRFFSFNTSIDECLVIARRPAPKAKRQPTMFLSLQNNPPSPHEAHKLAEAIQAKLNGLKEASDNKLSDYGAVSQKFLEHSGAGWNFACFYDTSLAAHYDNILSTNPSLIDLGKAAHLRPAGSSIRVNFDRVATRQNPDMRALWDHKSDRQTSMHTSSDNYIAPKEGKLATANNLWAQRGNLLIVSRCRLNLVRTTAAFSPMRILSSAFVPVTPKAEENQEEICKAWCVWLNSTFGIISFLNHRTRDLTYPNFSQLALQSLPVPEPSKCDILRLARVYGKYAKSELLALPRIEKDSVRKALDEAVLASVPGLTDNVAELRRLIAAEPSVHNKKNDSEI